MIQFDSLGSVNEFAERTGQSIQAPGFLKSYTAALALGHQLATEHPNDQSSRISALFVTDVDRNKGVFLARAYEGSKEGAATPFKIDEVPSSAYGSLHAGSVFWQTMTRKAGVKIGYDCELTFPLAH